MRIGARRAELWRNIQDCGVRFGPGDRHVARSVCGGRARARELEMLDSIRSARKRLCFALSARKITMDAGISALDGALGAVEAVSCRREEGNGPGVC